MTIWWCRGCGREDVSGGSPCPTCGAALQAADINWLLPGGEGEETTFELEPEPEERAAIVDALVHEKISHRWETDIELVVADVNADTVDSILDEVLGIETRSEETYGGPLVSTSETSEELQNSDSLNVNFDDDPYQDQSSQDGYDVISKLFISSKRLQGKRNDDDIIDFVSTAGMAMATPPPFGVDEEVWADILSAVRNLAAVLEDDKSASVDGDLKALQNQLQEMV